MRNAIIYSVLILFIGATVALVIFVSRGGTENLTTDVADASVSGALDNRFLGKTSDEIIDELSLVYSKADDDLNIDIDFESPDSKLEFGF